MVTMRLSRKVEVEGQLQRIVLSVSESKRAYFLQTMNYGTKRRSVLTFPKAHFCKEDVIDRLYSEFDMATSVNKKA